MRELDASLARDSFRKIFMDEKQLKTKATTKAVSCHIISWVHHYTKRTESKNMVANKDEQAMVKDIFGIDVDIYENKYAGTIET